MTKAPDCKSKLTGWLCSFTLTWIPALDSKLVGWLCSFTLTWIPALDQSTGLWLKAYCMTVFIHFNMNPSSWPKHRTVTQSWLDDCVHSLQCESKSWLDICYSKLAGWLCSFSSTWSPAVKWSIVNLGFGCVTTLTPATTLSLCLSLVMCCILMWGLSSAMISSFCNSIHPPEMEISFWKIMCAWVMKLKQSHTHSPRTLWNAFVSEWLYILGDP